MLIMFTIKKKTNSLFTEIFMNRIIAGVENKATNGWLNEMVFELQSSQRYFKCI